MPATEQQLALCKVLHCKLGNILPSSIFQKILPSDAAEKSDGR